MENKINKIVGDDIFDIETYQKESNLFKLGLDENILTDLVTKKDNSNIKDVMYAKYSWSDPWMVSEFSILREGEWYDLKYQKFTDGSFNYSINLDNSKN